MGTLHDIDSDDEPGRNMIREIARCGKRMRFELDKTILVLAPIALLIMLFVIWEYVVLIQYFGG